jgi:dTDP-4-dehydrorhamnose 3,5-epimerase
MGRQVRRIHPACRGPELKFVPLPLAGAFVIEIDPIEDERGFFARTFCIDEFREQGLEPCIAQCSISFNKRKGTLRGLHYQAPPHQEAKIVRCIRGAIHDVIVDLRLDSATYRRWAAVDLTAENRRAVYVPKHFAHGFQTLADASDVHYEISERFVPEAGRGLRWNDPAFAIEWPIGDPIVSPRDAGYPDYREVSD